VIINNHDTSIADSIRKILVTIDIFYTVIK